VFHRYSDGPELIPQVRCYSLAEIMAEKVRALFERSGWARDVYDVVNVGRNLRAELPRDRIATLAAEKFAFKGLEPPEPALILARVDPDVLATDWVQSLRHQLPVLPPVGECLAALREILDWLLAAAAAPALAHVPARHDEVHVPPIRFVQPLVVTRPLGLGAVPTRGAVPDAAFGSRMDRLRYAARNRLLARVDYHGVPRVVEPYSLRMPKTGNLLLYLFERERGGGPGSGIKAFKVAELGEVTVTDNPFQPRYLVEL
jgi:hypothetical protein